MSVQMSVGLLQPVSSLAEQEKPIVAVKIVPKLAEGHVRRRFHLALILDVSGSMEGDRIASVKETLQLLIGAMEDGDMLTMIEYQSVAKSIAAAVELNETNRTKLLADVDSLKAGGGTNLQAGLAILHANASNKYAKAIDSIFIMTDGQINEGVTDAVGLYQLLIGTGLPALGVPVNTLGYGSDHNSCLLRDIAVKSRGTYTYADTDELLPTIIGDILAGLATEVGRCARLAIPADWQCLELGADDGADAKHSYNIGTLMSEKPQWVLLEGPPKSEIPDFKVDHVKFTLRWKSGDVEHEKSCCLAEDGSIDANEVAEQLNRARVARGLAVVSEMLTSGDIEKAKSSLDQLKLILSSSAVKDSPFSSRLNAQVDEMKGTVENVNQQQQSVISQGYGGGGYGLNLNNAYSGPSMAAIASRAASNAAVLGMQRGVYCMQSSDEGQMAFGNIQQQAAQASMKQHYGELKSKRK